MTKWHAPTAAREVLNVARSLKEYIDSLGIAAGVVHAYAGAAAPNNWLLCDGTSYLRTTYPDLFQALGGAASPWGLPDGTHFNVPDLRGRTVIGVGTGAGLTARTLAAALGEENHLLTGPESGIQAHNHNANNGSGGGFVEAGTGITDPPGAVGQNIATTGAGYVLISRTVTAGPSNATSAHNNMQPSVALNWIIRT